MFDGNGSLHHIRNLVNTVSEASDASYNRPLAGRKCSASTLMNIRHLSRSSRSKSLDDVIDHPPGDRRPRSRRRAIFRIVDPPRSDLFVGFVEYAIQQRQHLLAVGCLVGGPCSTLGVSSEVKKRFGQILMHRVPESHVSYIRSLFSRAASSIGRSVPFRDLRGGRRLRLRARRVRLGVPRAAVRYMLGWRLTVRRLLVIGV